MKMIITNDVDILRKRPWGGVKEFEQFLDEFINANAQVAEVDWSGQYITAESARTGLQRAIGHTKRDKMVRACVKGDKLLIVRCEGNI